MMKSHPGEIYLTCDKSLGIFIPHEYHVAAKKMIDDALDGADPQLDRDALRNLREIVGHPAAHQDENGPPVILPRTEALHFEVIVAQFFLRRYLPERVKRVCQLDGTWRIEDPAYMAERADRIQREHDRNVLINNLAAQQQIDSGHTTAGLLRLLFPPQKPALEIPCDECGGVEYDRFKVTFCPGCRKRREESLLIQCPYCEYDFVASVREQIWTTSANALRAFNVSYKRSAVINAIHDLDGFATTRQVEYLLGHVTADTGLVDIARCRLIDNRRRDTLLLVTTDGVCWSSRKCLSFKKDGSLQWKQVASVSGKNDYRLTMSGGATLTFSSFTSDGKALGIGVPDGN
jgi:hypothetical protein